MSRRVQGTTDPRESLKNVLAFDSRDWGQRRGDAWIWGIVFGWDDEKDPDDGAMSELAAMHGWDESEVDRLRKLHENFNRLELRDEDV